MTRMLFDHLAAIGKRKIAPFGPQGKQVAVMGTARLTGLTRDAGGDAAVPIGEVEHLSVRRTVNLAEFVIVPRIIRGVHVAASRNRTKIEGFGIFGAEAAQRVFEGRGM